MASRTLSHLYPSYVEAVQVVADLTALGIPAGDISLIESETDARLPPEVVRDEARSPAVSGLTVGMAIGAAIGALDGVGAITIPTTGPLVDLGWLAPTVVGGVIGAILGAIIGAVSRVGVTGKQSHAVAEGLNQGQHLVMVRVDEAYTSQVQAVLDRPHAEIPAGPEPLFDEEPVPGEGSTRAADAAIYRAEERIERNSA